jgi:alkylation response protein AidB-like acyl-CoA dehydrogenase
MNKSQLMARLQTLVREDLPRPGVGGTPLRHQRLMEIGRENLTLARLAEAHWDAVAILAEAGRRPEPGQLYGVWASEKPGESLELKSSKSAMTLKGSKMFCSGAGLVDRALVTVRTPDDLLIDVNLKDNAAKIRFDGTGWRAKAFGETHTSQAFFTDAVVTEIDIIDEPGWYVARPGFWHGACGPAACWAGGALGLVDFAMKQKREDPHTLAHLAAIYAAGWGLQSYLELAGREIDDDPLNEVNAQIRALSVRHLVEQACTDVLRRVARAYGPSPLAMDDDLLLRYQELDLYLRQSHAERDLEQLGRQLKHRLSLCDAQEHSGASRLSIAV